MNTYIDIVGRECVGFSIQKDARPFINLKHIDGPLLVFSDGQLHWLTLWERLLVYLQFTDADKIERQRRPNLVKALGR